jgi:hypothetical protein
MVAAENARHLGLSRFSPGETVLAICRRLRYRGKRGCRGVHAVDPSDAGNHGMLVSATRRNFHRFKMLGRAGAERRCNELAS